MSTEPHSLSSTRGSATFPVPLRLKVLVVDDNTDAASSTVELLKICGADAQACYRGAAALETLEWFSPDACVLDLSMPGMDGFELAARIRQANPGTLLVALTALNDVRTMDRETEAGFEVHFTKPVDPAQLLHTLGERVAQKRATEALRLGS
jgi:two-component system, OmpR family, response regulator